MDEIGVFAGAEEWLDDRNIPREDDLSSPGRRYRVVAHEWRAFPGKTLDPGSLVPFRTAASAGLTSTAVSRVLSTWPRLAQIASLGLVFCAAIFGSAHVVSASAGLAIGFLALSLLFFGSYAAYRRGIAERLFGPNVSLLGIWASLVIVIAICLNAVLGS
jgi:hypothetical protein